MGYPNFRLVARTLLAVLFSVTGVARLPAALAINGTVTADSFALPGFGANGLKAWDMQGRQAVYRSEQTIDITDLKIRLFPGNGNLTVESTIASPQATVFTQNSTARGPGFLDITGSGYHVTGRDWIWDGKQDVTYIKREVLVEFRAASSSQKAGAPLFATPGDATATHLITIRSDQLEIHQEKEPPQNRFLFSGNITITDESGRTTCENLEVIAARSVVAPGRAASSPNPAPATPGVGRIDRIYARNHVVIQQDNLEALGEQAELIPAANQAILSGFPRVNSHTEEGIAVLQGSRISWWRDTGNIVVDPLADGPNDPPRVRLALPSLSHYQDNDSPAPPPAGAGTKATPMTILGESLRATFTPEGSHIVIERSVRLDDAQLNLDADQLEADFGPRAPSPNGLMVSPLPAAGRQNRDTLKHLLASGNVFIHQTESGRDTTADRAEIIPAPAGQIILDGKPRVVDPLGEKGPLPKPGAAERRVAVLSGRTITLFTETNHAIVLGGAAQPASLTLPSLPSLDRLTKGAAGETRITSNTITMNRGNTTAANSTSQFIFDDNVQIRADDLETTCGVLEVYSRNASSNTTSTANPLGASTEVGEIVQLIAKNQVLIKQRDYRATASRAEIFPQTAVNDVDVSNLPSAAPARGAPPPAPASPGVPNAHRYVKLTGDPTGQTGPIRPVVELPAIQDMGSDAATGAANSTVSSKPAAPTFITSDKVELLTSPAGNIYEFSGDVHIDSGALHVTCDFLQAFATPTSADSATVAPAAGASTPASLQKILADGHVHIVQENRTATAGQAEILPGPGLVTLTNNPLVYDTNDKANATALTKPSVQGPMIQLRRGDHTAQVLNPPATGSNPKAARKQLTVVVPNTDFDFGKATKKTPAAPNSK